MRKIILILLFFGLFGCSKNQQTQNNLNVGSRETLNVNFNSNINTIDPDQANSESEKFIKNLLYHNTNNRRVPGKFELVIADGDILYLLKRKSREEGKVNTINIRFIKNNTRIIKDLIDGQLDIIKTDSSFRSDNRLSEIINNPYHLIKSSKTSTGLIQYTTYYNCSDSLIQSLKPQLIKSNDVLLQNQQITDKVYMDSIPKIFDSEPINYDELVIQNYPVVINRLKYSSELDSPIQQLLDSLNNQDKYQDHISIISIDTIKYDYYLYNSSLIKIRDFSNISKDIDMLEYKTIKSF